MERKTENKVPEINWKMSPPPRETIVWGQWNEHGLWTLVKTCKRGCCVRMYPPDGLGSMYLPHWWKEPTQEELNEHEKERPAV